MTESVHSGSFRTSPRIAKNSKDLGRRRMFCISFYAQCLAMHKGFHAWKCMASAEDEAELGRKVEREISDAQVP